MKSIALATIFLFVVNAKAQVTTAPNHETMPTTQPGSTKSDPKKTVIKPKQNSDRVVSGAENPDVNCIDRQGKTVTKDNPLYKDCEREMKNAK